jgi:hypothetical protein
MIGTDLTELLFFSRFSRTFPAAKLLPQVNLQTAIFARTSLDSIAIPAVSRDAVFVSRLLFQYHFQCVLSKVVLL